MKQEAKQVHAIQNYSVLVCSDACEHKQSQNIQRFLTFLSHRFFENPMNARHPLPRKMSTHTQHTRTHAYMPTHTQHTHSHPHKYFSATEHSPTLPKVHI